MGNISKTLFFVFVLMMSLTSFGQNVADTVRTFRIETSDGNVYTGTIVNRDTINLVLKTTSIGEIKIPLAQIKSETELTHLKIVNNSVWLPNPQSSRYFWAPNGYGLRKGESYYQNIWVLYNQFSFGLDDHFSLGFGTIPLFLFAGTATPFWVVPKFSIPIVTDKVNLGTGAFLGTILGAEGSGVFGLLYGTSTFGSRDKNISLGLAYGFAGGDWMDRPIINVSSMIRTGPRGYFITENFIIPYTESTYEYEYGKSSIKNKAGVVISIGGRSIIRNFGLDYSLWIPINVGIDHFIAIPFLGVTIPLNKQEKR
jgi:hypothetical protein